MKSAIRNWYQVRIDDHPRAGVACSSALTPAGSTRYTCSMHPEIVRNTPGKCPKCGMTLVPL